MKITTESDLARADVVFDSLTPADPRAAACAGAEQWEVRVGMGFDVHRFGPGDHVMLCGVRVAHEAGVVSHSDGDVALHALVDAMLGALGAGDIGTHFPPSDATWRDADSALFVAHARALMEARGARLSHADLTLICERPRIGPHRAAMVARLAELLGVAPERIGLKATSTERLGFTGRGEGIAAQAVVTLRMRDAR